MTDGIRSTPVEFSEADAATKRTRRRDSLFIAARLRIEDGNPIDIRVRNLSEGGLMAEGTPPLAIGAAVTIELRNLGPVPGKVAWYTDERAGIAFDVAIDPVKARKPVAVRAIPAAARKTFAC